MSSQATLERPDAELPGLRGNREFLLLWTGAGVSFVGSRLANVAYPMLAIWYTQRASEAGVAAFCANLPYVLQLLAGPLVDRVDRRRLMLACDLGRLLAVGSLCVTLALGRWSLVLLGAVAFTESCLAIVHRIAERAAVPRLVRPADLPAALARNEARQRGGGLVGQPLGGFLFTLERWVPFAGTLVCCAASLVSLLLIRSPLGGGQDGDGAAPAAGGVRGLLGSIAEGGRWVTRTVELRMLLILVASSNLLFAVLTLALQAMVREGSASSTRLGVDLGTILGVSGLGGLLGALAASWVMRRVDLAVLVIGCNAAWAVLMLPMAWLRDPFALGGLLAGMSAAGALWNVAAAVYLQRVTPDALQGRVLSIGILVAFGPLPLGSLLGGALLDHYGVPRVVLGMTALMLLLALASAAVPSLRRLRMPDEP